MRTLKLLSILMAIGSFSFMSLEAKSQDKATKEVVYKSDDLKGPGCASKVSTALLQEEGIENTSVNLESKTIKVKYNPASTNKTKIQETIAEAGYAANETKEYKGKADACCSDKTIKKKGCCNK